MNHLLSWPCSGTDDPFGCPGFPLNWKIHGVILGAVLREALEEVRKNRLSCLVYSPTSCTDLKYSKVLKWLKWPFFRLTKNFGWGRTVHPPEKRFDGSCRSMSKSRWGPFWWPPEMIKSPQGLLIEPSIHLPTGIDDKKIFKRTSHRNID